MCQEIHISDVRLALLDYFDEEEEKQLDTFGLLASFDDPPEEDDYVGHMAQHASRATRLDAQGDEQAATIHKALIANMRRAAG